LIRLEDVTKTFKRGRDGEVVALDSVSLEVTKGEFVFIVGPSGSGKSTLMRLLTREQTPDSGELWVAGKNLGKLRSWKTPLLRREIGYVFQDFKLLANKTVRENVSFAMEVIGRNRRDIRTRVPEVLELVGLTEKADAMPHELSGGQQQRVSIARAFVNNPRLLLCDEPTGNLDPATSVGIMKLLDRINRTGTTVVMATHDQQIVDSMRRRVVELANGRIVRDQVRGVYGYGA
jgi:cell division transport system ATP-binding protein